MNREELAARVAERAGVQRRVANQVMAAVFDAIGEALEANQKITIAGFGTFEVRERAGRVGRNPRTGEAIRIEARRVPTFTPGKGLRDRVSQVRHEMVSAEPEQAERPARKQE